MHVYMRSGSGALSTRGTNLSWSDTVVNQFIHNTGDDWLGIKGRMAQIAHNFLSLFLKIPRSDFGDIFFSISDWFSNNI